MGRNARIERKRKILNITAVIIVLILCLSGCSSKDYSIEYERKLISTLQTQEFVEAKEIFDFEWDRAFAISENYIDGKGFTEKYNLDISIEAVPESSHDTLRRVVFVDSNGEFVFLFSFWDADELCLAEDGIVIYPETIIKKSDKRKSGFCVEFIVQQEDYLILSDNTGH